MKVNYNKQISTDFEPLRFHSEKKQSALAEKVLKMNSYAFKKPKENETVNLWPGVSRTTGQTTYGDKILIEKRLLNDSSSYQQTADISSFRMDTLDQQRQNRANKIRMPTEILSRNP